MPRNHPVRMTDANADWLAEDMAGAALVPEPTAEEDAALSLELARENAAQAEREEAEMRACIICARQEPKQSMIVYGKEVCVPCAERIARALLPTLSWGTAAGAARQAACEGASRASE